MLHNLLPIVGEELNEFLMSRYNTNEDRLIISNLINQDGSLNSEGLNKVVCSLVNIEEETTLKSSYGVSSSAGGYVSGSGSIHMNLTVMFSAMFQGKSYVESLKFLSGVIYFFQSKAVFTSSNTPGLSSNIDKVVFDIVNLDYKEMNSIFSMIGAKYMPSVVYKVRMLTFSNDDINDVTPSISGISGITPSDPVDEDLEGKQDTRDFPGGVIPSEKPNIPFGFGRNEENE
jgi:hypothetical protein